MKRRREGGFQRSGLCVTESPFITSKTPFSDSEKVQSFDVEGKEIIKDITDLEIEHGYGF
jgi:hypothetical protein